jgi:hypothetical protein
MWPSSHIPGDASHPRVHLPRPVSSRAATAGPTTSHPPSPRPPSQANPYHPSTVGQGTPDQHAAFTYGSPAQRGLGSPFPQATPTSHGSPQTPIAGFTSQETKTMAKSWNTPAKMWDIILKVLEHYNAEEIDVGRVNEITAQLLQMEVYVPEHSLSNFGRSKIKPKASPP